MAASVGTTACDDEWSELSRRSSAPELWALCERASGRCDLSRGLRRLNVAPMLCAREAANGEARVPSPALAPFPRYPRLRLLKGALVPVPDILCHHQSRRSSRTPDQHIPTSSLPRAASSARRLRPLHHAPHGASTAAHWAAQAPTRAPQAHRRPCRPARQGRARERRAPRRSRASSRPVRWGGPAGRRQVVLLVWSRRQCRFARQQVSAPGRDCLPLPGAA